MERFNTLKKNHTGDKLARRNEAADLLKTLRATHPDVSEDVDEELEYFIAMRGCAGRDELLRIFSAEKDIKLEQYLAWLGEDLDLMSALLWFDVMRNFHGMVSLHHMGWFKLFKISVLKVVVYLVEVASQSSLGGTGGFLQAASGGG